MVTHKAYLTLIGRKQKTAKTECGITVKTSLIAIDSDATCSECRARVDQSRASMKELAATLLPLDNDATRKKRAELEESLAQSEVNKYHTSYFFKVERHRKRV